MTEIEITIKGIGKRHYPAGTTAKTIMSDLELDEKAIIAVKVNDNLIDIDSELTHDAEIGFLTFKDLGGKEIFWHSTAHLMAQAVIELFPDAKPTIGPVIEQGFYYDFDKAEPFLPEDLKKIERKMHELAKKKLPIIRTELSKQDAIEKFKDNPYKLEIIEEFGDVSIYSQGEFFDLCRGPHVPDTGFIKAYKLTKISGAYWRGDVKNKQLQRIYGISFPSKDELKEYVKIQEEALKRDHRVIGKQLDLFSIHEEGPGFVFFHPKGLIIRNILVDFWQKEHEKNRYLGILTPMMLTRSLWEQSGHWDHYKDNMYFTKIDDIDYALKPMNCPGGILIYKSKSRSYRDLPLRMSELGLVHRHELSGVIHGLFRVRAFTQDDAHIYMTDGQAKEEICGVIDLVDHFYKTFGFSYEVELSTKPDKFIGTDDMWDNATNALKDALKQKNTAYEIKEGDGAFYGPKIDFHIKDCLDRKWQCATIQLDFAMPEKFDLKYMGPDGTENHRPVMIHRTIYGSLERFMGILIEHYAGKLPLWLSPVQVRILTIAERFEDYSNDVACKMKEAGIRVEVDARAESISKKVREAQLDKINYIIVIGENELNDNTVTVRTRDNVVHGSQKVEQFIADLKKEIEEKK